MAKLSLKPNPTFKAKVGIPVAGGVPVDVEFTFRHKTKTDLQIFMDSAAERTDRESLMAIVAGWELEETYNEASVDELLENYVGSASAVYRAWVSELLQNKAKN